MIRTSVHFYMHFPSSQTQLCRLGCLAYKALVKEMDRVVSSAIKDIVIVQLSGLSSKYDVKFESWRTL